MKITFYKEILGDSISVDDTCMESFSESYRFKSLSKDLACFKNLEKVSSLDLVLTNSPYSFLNSFVVESGLSDFQKMVSIMKTIFQKLKPYSLKNVRKIDHYRDYTR